MVTSLGFFPSPQTPGSAADPGTFVIACKGSALQHDSITPTITTSSARMRAPTALLSFGK